MDTLDSQYMSNPMLTRRVVSQGFGSSPASSFRQTSTRAANLPSLREAAKQKGRGSMGLGKMALAANQVRSANRAVGGQCVGRLNAEVSSAPHSRSSLVDPTVVSSQTCPLCVDGLVATKG